MNKIRLLLLAAALASPAYALTWNFTTETVASPPLDFLSVGGDVEYTSNSTTRFNILGAGYNPATHIVTSATVSFWFADDQPGTGVGGDSGMGSDAAERVDIYVNGTNVTGTQNVIDACIKFDVPKLIFSSTAAVYAANVKPLTEESPLGSASPYGHSKALSEQMLRDITAATDLQAICLRYFNVAGADPEMRTGQSGNKTTHLIARACQAAAGDISEFELYGDDYATPDGTCIRDFIHVSDLAAAHRVVLETKFDAPFNVFNCGYGHGYSVKEIVDTFKHITDIDFPVTFSPRRPGDLPQLVANSSALKEATGWQPANDDIQTIIRTAWNWYQRERLKI